MWILIVNWPIFVHSMEDIAGFQGHRLRHVYNECIRWNLLQHDRCLVTLLRLCFIYSYAWCALGTLQQHMEHWQLFRFEWKKCWTWKRKQHLAITRVLLVSFFVFFLNFHLIFFFCSNVVLERSDSIEDTGHIRLHLLLCLVIAWVLIYLGLSLGTKSLGKVYFDVSRRNWNNVLNWCAY